MIRRLRLKFVVVNMSIVVLMLFVILGLVFYFTSANLEAESTQMMQSLAVQPIQLGAPGQLAGEEVRLPFFKLQLGLGGELVAADGGYYDLSDRAFLNQLVERTMASPQRTGVLEEYGLRYYRLDSPVNRCLVFSDISSERATLEGLMRTCLILGAVSFFGFLWGSILLSKWAVRPVELAWKGQRQFVADASHELKTPLTVIMTNAELAQSQDYGEEDRRRFLSSILTMSRQMKELIGQMLELARADDGAPTANVGPVDLSKLVNDALLPFEPIFFEGGLELKSQVCPGVRGSGDGGQLRQVVEILLDNAGKYARPGGTVWVSLARRGRGKCLLTVANQGEPIGPEELERLFERFYRADRARSRTGSFGLGLSIARSIVTSHRGRIWAESREGINRFLVELPVSAPVQVAGV